MKIVVVEDEAPIRNGLKGILPRLNPDYEVVGTAVDGEEGLKVIGELRPDLVILDIRMPKLDGLSMLGQLREQGSTCRAVVLTAYSDFSYAKQAIELGIDNYLLKPIKIPELEKTLEIVQESINMEQGQEKMLTLERIVRGAVLSELPIDDELNQITKERYGLDVHEKVALFAVWPEEEFKTVSGDIVRLLETCASHSDRYRCCVVESEWYGLVLAMLYQIEEPEALQEYFSSSVVPMIANGVKAVPLVFSWAECSGLTEAPEALALVLSEREWNLDFPEHTLISQQRIDALQTVPLKYPIDLESQIRGAVANRDQAGFERCNRQFFHVCMDEPHHPEDIREACMRYCLSVINIAKNAGGIKEAFSAQAVFQRITQAFTWSKIEAVVDELYRNITAVQETDQDVSLLVRRTRQMIEEYYNQGITLEETAQKLCVSEEYLSSQFKKETGASFTETVRKYRIEKAKELLLYTNLKINQIADMVGYADPKYMSRVFREEVGVLPAEYRKDNK